MTSDSFYRRAGPMVHREKDEILIVMQGITKRFPGVLANDNIEFDLKTGEVHGLLGENGAGKTTLMNILYGLYHPDEGEIYFNKRKVEIDNPRDAIRIGIGMIHQSFMLIPNLTVTENIIIGFESKASIHDAERKVLELSEEHGIKVDPKAKIWQLSVGEQQRVEIIKAFYRGADVLILDEPTSVLTPDEADKLFTLIKSFVKEDRSAIFITHKIREATEICDRITILKKGKAIGTMEKKDFNKEKIATMMVGRDVKFTSSKKGEKHPSRVTERIIEVKNIRVLNDRGLPAVNDISFKISKGEIFGLAGVAGNGQVELIEAIAGIRKCYEGKIFLGEHDITNKSPHDIRKHGLGYVPEDRYNTGSINDLTVAENMIFGIHTEHPFATNFIFNRNEISEYSKRLIREYDIVTPSEDTPARFLSGGNLQKLILARELSRDIKILLAIQTTRGLDIKATQYIQKKLLETKAKGIGIVLASEDLDEIFLLSDRIGVIYEGKIVGILPRQKATIEEVGRMMSGAITASLDSKV